MWLVNWLLERTDKVLDWFGTFYDTAKEIITNIWDWTFDLVYNVYRQSIDYVKARIKEVTKLIDEIKGNLLDRISAARDFTTNYAEFLYNRIITRISGLSANFSSLLENAKQSIITWAIDTFSNVTTWLDARKRELLDFLDETFPWIASIRKSVNELITFFRGGEFYTVLTTLRGYLRDLSLFLDNPSKFIMAIFQYILDHYIADWLADQLGTEQADLPPRQVDKIIGR